VHAKQEQADAAEQAGRDGVGVDVAGVQVGLRWAMIVVTEA
jgi:hypothetical protein